MRSGCVALALVLAALARPCCGDVDRLGDELPDGAVQRLGSLRLVPPGGASDFAHLPGDRLASVIGGSLDIWDLATGQHLSRVRVGSSSLTSIRLRADGEALLLADSGGAIREWSLAEGRELRAWPSEQVGLTTADYTPNGAWIVSMGSLPPTLRVWDAATGALVREIRGGLGYFSTLVCMLDSRRVWVGGGHAQCLEQYDLATGERLIRLFEDYTVYDMTLSADGKRLLVGSRHKATERDAETGEELHAYSGHHGHAVPSVSYSPDLARLLTGSRDGSIRIWDREGSEPAVRWTAHQGHVTGMRVSPDGGWVVSYGAGLFAQSDARTGQPRIPWDRHSGAVTCAAFDPTGGRVVSASADATFRVWDPRSGESLLCVESIGLGVYAAVVSPDGGRAAVGCKDGLVREYDVGSGALLRELAGHRGYVRGVAYTPGGDRLLSCADDGSVIVWSSERGEPEGRLLGHKGGVLAVAVSPDGRSAATAGRDGTVRIWDIETRTASHALEAHRGWVECVAFTGDRSVVSAGRDGRVALWDAEAGTLSRAMAHGKWVKALALSSDGTRAWSAADDGEIVEWDMVSGAQVARRAGHQGGVRSLTASPDGSLLVSASADASLLVWDLARFAP